jgi:hypothetical protein
MVNLWFENNAARIYLSADSKKNRKCFVIQKKLYLCTPFCITNLILK